MSYESAYDLAAEIEELTWEQTEDCPKCGGEGEINLGFAHPDDGETKTCEFCDGEGTVEDEIVLSTLERLRDAYDEITSNSGDGRHADLIPTDNFTEYAQQYADDIHGVSSGWPFDHIDWDAAADDLMMDYTEITIEGVSYLYR
jgi:hypothetical protein